jgi:hypothetical protein
VNRQRRSRSALRTAVSAALACAGALFLQTASALPVLPQGAGYGLETAAGRGGAIHKVTNLNDSGAGSLRACVDADGPRVCVFEVSGAISMNRDLVIRNPNITIAGQTAPSPGVLLRGAGLSIQTSDVLVQHIRVRVGDAPEGPAMDNRDALKIDSPSGSIRNVVIDHCSFSWAIDETASVWAGWDEVTLSNNIFAEPLHQSHHSKGPHGYGIIVGPWKGRISVVGNLMAHQVERNPLTRAQRAVIVNNVIYNRMNMDVDVQGEKGIATQTTVIGNVFLRGADYTRSHKPVLVRMNGGLKLPDGSKLYVADNIAAERTENDEWSVVDTLGGSLPSSVKANEPPAWPKGLTRLPASGDVVLQNTLRFAGARPADRDPVDERIVRQVREGSGQIVNCVSDDGSARCKRNAGGWPEIAENHRTLQPPANPHETTPSGYTNLELWLHEMSAAVEGRSTARPSAPALTSRN